MKKIWRVLMAAMALSVAISVHAGTIRQETSLTGPGYPVGLDDEVAKKLKSGALKSATLRDEVGEVERGWYFKFPWIARQVRYEDYSVSYRNDTWIPQPLPIRHVLVPDRWQTFLAIIPLVLFGWFMAWVFCRAAVQDPRSDEEYYAEPKIE